MAKTKVDTNTAWSNIFERYKLLHQIRRDGYVDLSADAIKEVDGKEARLMTKVDFRENLPTIMRDEGLSILAIKNGLYRIAKNDPFIDIEERISSPIIELPSPTTLCTIDPFNIKSESAALDLAFISGMCAEVFQEESFLSVRGRLRGELEFSLGDTPYSVDGVQIEVDGGYEGKDALHLVEAKIGFRNNINIRQLLYPQLYWQRQLQEKKKVQSYIFYLQNDIFRFIPYIYDGIVGYADHAHQKVFRFKDQTRDFSLYDIAIDQSKIDTSIPFPQADKFDKIQDMLFLIAKRGSLTKEELHGEFDLVTRQIDYYLNVLKWLKLSTEENAEITLSTEGQILSALPFKQRIEALATRVFAEPICHALLHKQTLPKERFEVYKVYSPSTQQRRVRTITAWINYFKEFSQQRNLFTIHSS